MTADWLEAFTAWVGSHPDWLVMALFITALVESLAIAGLIVPGVALLFALAALAGKTGIGLGEALLWTGFGAIIGDLLSFALGRLLQDRLHVIWPFSRYPAMIASGETFFRTHGGKSILIGRFVGPIRPVMPLVAGALQMPWQRFVAFNLLSATAWAPAYVLPGFFVGSAMSGSVQPPPHFYPILATAGAVLVVIYALLLRLRLGVGEGSPFYQWLEGRMAGYDTTHRFWRLYTNERPSRRGEFPLPSLMLAIATLSLFLILGQLTPVSHLLQQLDQQVLSWFRLLRQPLLDPPMVLLTLLGDPPVLIAGAVLASLSLGFRGYYAAAAHIAVAAAVTTTLVWLLKAGFAVPRPEAVLQPPSSGAFPSGHTTGITVAATLLASFIAAEGTNRQRWQTYVLLSAPLVPVALSRLYLGVHWFTDVLGGLCLGLAITGLTRASYSRFDRVPVRADATTWLALAAWLLYALIYIRSEWAGALARYTPL